MGQIRNSIRGFLAPGKYIQGYGELNKLEGYARSFGSNFIAFIDTFLFETFSAKLSGVFASSSIRCERFEGQVSDENAERYIEISRGGNYDAIIGIGGGRTLDMAKLVAHMLKLPLIIVPTSAATDAPTSALSVIYSPAGNTSARCSMTKDLTLCWLIPKSSPRLRSACWLPGWAMRWLLLRSTGLPGIRFVQQSQGRV